uniref:Uncharacterized protein n=1 Tax=viral metagenome TaxID=1070528 RepID=A0A6C0ERG8_9ZZZZ
MSSTSDTSTIDEKKGTSGDTNSSIATKTTNFFTTILMFILLIVIHFSIGGIVLYGCKLGQSNILPTNEKCFPYTDTKPEIQNILTNLFTTSSDPEMSLKLNFPYDKDNSKNMILDILRNYKNEPESNFLANYFIAIMESLISFNYASLNFILNFMNELPEIIIILFGPLVLALFSTIIFLFDHLYVMYLWFANMGWFFKQNINTNHNHKPIWEPVTILQPIDYWIAIWLVILFCILFFVVLAALPVLPFITMSWCIMSSIFYRGTMNKKDVTVLTIVQELFKNYKVIIMSFISFFVILSAFSNLGGIPGMFSIFVLILIIFNIIPIGVFKESIPENLSVVVSNKQADKICNIKDSSSVKHGLLYNLIFPQSGGKSLVKELKNLGKKLSNK